MPKDEQIDFLNQWVRARLAPSKIQGIGVVALRDIPKDTPLQLGMFPRPFQISRGNINKLFPEVREYLTERWPTMYWDKGFMYPDCNYMSYMNHSDEPNYDAFQDRTLKKIRAGEEITEDYRLIPGWSEAFTFLSKK